METIWPVAAGGSGTTVEWRQSIAARLERMLHQHVIAPWFPRVVDAERGGYSTDLDRAWRPAGPDARMLEYQARMMRSAARLGIAYPRDPRWPEIARHGMRYINDFMRDEREGGWYWLVDRAGTPLANGSKTAHSVAYLIGGMVEAHQVTGDEEALSSAQEAFDWLESVLHDADHGGYHGWATRDGRPIMDRSQVEGWQRRTDPLGHDIGLKDANVHSDLLESLKRLYEARPSSALRDRLSEMYRVVAEHFVDADGRVHYLLAPDLTPVSGPAQPGYAFQFAFRLPLIAPHVGFSAPDALGFARRALDWGLTVGWSERGGVFESVGSSDRGRRKWWVQTEALQAMTLLHLWEAGDYRARIDHLLDLFESDYVDRQHGGWFEIPRGDWTLQQRVLGRHLPKAHRWKDASHETDSALVCIRMLRGLPAEGALES